MLHYDLIVIGSGPAGQKAAIQAAKAGRKVAVLEKATGFGGACVQFGTIPSKTLRETTASLSSFRRRTADAFDLKVKEHLAVESLMRRKDDVRDAHVRYIENQLRRNNIECVRARGRFLSPTTMEAVRPGGERTILEADAFMIATGSKPRTPP